MDIAERQRRHDEKWQHEVLSGMSRLLDVLHDISDAVRELAEAQARQWTLDTNAAPAPSRTRPQLLSVEDLAELLGVTPGTVRGLRSSREAPVATKVGRRVFFDRDDVDEWLRQRREPTTPDTVPW